MDKAPSLDWEGLLVAGLSRLQLDPTVFWALTPAELALRLGQRPQMMRLDRAALDALMARYPDNP